jgi:hypothetical protein
MGWWWWSTIWWQRREGNVDEVMDQIINQLCCTFSF